MSVFSPAPPARWARTLARQGLLVLLTLEGACSRPDAEAQPAASAAPSVTPPPAPSEALPRALYLPDGGDVAPPSAPALGAGTAPDTRVAPRCAPEMVSVRGGFCIDRFEAQLVRADDGRELSPYYPPSAESAKRNYQTWLSLAATSGDAAAQATPVPRPPDWLLVPGWEPKATNQRNVVPSGYVSGTLAERACKNAGKRLCTASEWLTACKGESARKFPYGEKYEQGRCNVFREAHPALLLHGDASTGHLDPRLNRVKFHGQPLLRTTGATPECKSVWGGDAIYDMVGNLDEWVEDEKGAFQGGFYSRSTREGCESRITAHPKQYYDYSLGVRCCQ